MKFKWCTKFLDYLKQSLSSQNDNPSALPSHLSLALPSIKKELHLSISPHSPPSAAGQAEEQRTHLEKHPARSSAPYKSMPSRKALPWGEV